MKYSSWMTVVLSCLLVTSCTAPETSAPTDDETAQPANALPAVSDAELADNPFRDDWQTPYGVPPFAQIDDDDYLPAISKAITELRSEIAAIIDNTAAPTFENTILALELAGASLNKVAYTFNNVTPTDSNDVLRELETQIFPMLTREFDAIVLSDFA